MSENDIKRYVGVKTNCSTLMPKIVEVGFNIRGDYINVVKGAVTGYEGANVKEICKDYLDKGVYARWVACMGTLNKYDKLEIPMSEIIKYLIDNEYITIGKEYGYIKEIRWLMRKDG